MATLSRDLIAASRMDALASSGVLVPPLWTARRPHGEVAAGALCWESEARLWSGDEQGMLKAWDIAAGRCESVISMPVGSKVRVSCIQAWPATGILVASHSEGLAFVDTRVGRVARHQYTKGAANCVSLVEHIGSMLVGIGTDFVKYDTRMFADREDTRTVALGSWSFSSEAAAASVKPTRSVTHVSQVLSGA